MDKDSYQAYEFLPSNNNGAEQEQFFIVQDDGTFLINRQVQFVAQVPDGVQSCTVYDVSQQQYFVDVDNSAELISVPDNFILPITEGSTNLYGNSYLLQAVPSTNNDQIEDVVIEQSKQMSSPSNADNENKQDSSCTEITLSDEQYKMLEQKGWVLLETNNKVFILDSVGLHDITSNNELINQLKTENQSPINLEIDSTRCTTTIKFDDSSTQNSSIEHDSVEFVIENASPCIEDEKPEISLDNVEKEEIISAKPETLDIQQSDAKFENSLKSEPQNPKDQKALRIQSKYFLKDLPDKIVLGKTVNGKNLVAKLVKSSDCPKITPVAKHKHQPEEPKIVSDKNAIKIIKTEDDPIENLIQKALHTEVKCSSEQVETAKEVVIQLVQLSTFQPSLVGRNLVITKEVNKMVDGKETSLVTGRVETLTKPKNGTWQFKYIPDLLQKLMTESVSKYPNMQESESNARTKYRPKEDYQYLHIHIIERLRADKIETVSITLHKRYLPIKSPIENLSIHTKYRQSSRLYACSSCASVFKTESELTEHQETQCIFMEAEDTLTIDTEKIAKGFDRVEVNPYYVIKTSKGTEYVCLQCSLSFNKFSNCQRHIKTHLRPKSTSDNKNIKEKEENVEEPILYKCKMCSSSYFHSATLSKHIIKAHIRSNNKLSI